MQRDHRGLPVSTRDAASLDAYARAAELFHAYEGNPLAEIDRALERDPGFVMGHCLKAAVISSTVERGLEPALRQAVLAGEALWAGANERERGHLAAARAWLDGDLERAVDLWGRVALAFPRDLVALQAAHLGDFSLGQQLFLRDRIAQALHAWDESVPGYGFVLGMYAFGLEETGDNPRAEAAGRRAVELQPRDGWAAHAVAHVMEMQGRLGEGVAWLTETSRGWAADNALAFHNHWHHALYRLDLGDVSGALDLYDRRVRPARSDVALELVDASALLWRLHLLGADVGGRMAALADDWRARIGERYYAFFDVHAMLALAAAGREADVDALLGAVAAAAPGAGTHARMVREVGLPLCRAVAAFARGDHALALDLLLAVRPVAMRFGGSNAQRDLLSLTALEAARRAGRLDVARALASERTHARPTNPAAWLSAARVADQAGETVRAEAARRQAARLRDRLVSGLDAGPAPAGVPGTVRWPAADAVG